MEDSNWFSSSLPYDFKVRHDGKINVWHSAPFNFDGETELKWYVAHVADSVTEAKRFIANA